MRWLRSRVMLIVLAVIVLTVAGLLALLLDYVVVSVSLISVAVLGVSLSVGAGYVSTRRMLVRAREVQQRDTHTVIARIKKVEQKLPKQVKTIKHAAEQKAAAPAHAVISVGNSLGSSGAYFGVGVEYEYAERAAKNPGRFETFILRTKSLAGREVLARAATFLQFDFSSLMELILATHGGYVPGAPKIAKQWDRQCLLSLAHVLVNQQLKPNDVFFAERIFKLVTRLHGEESLGKTDIYLYTEALAALGSHGQAQRLFRSTRMARRDPVQAAFLRLNELAAGGLENQEKCDRWVERFNAMLAREDIAPIQFKLSSGVSPLDSLYAADELEKVDGPLVSVLIPTYNGSAFLNTTLRCLQEQTWRNTELIVVDDCSDPSESESIKEICSDYSNVMLVRQPTNLGAYVARNRGLELASGEFITVHDDDDWSHPQKLQVQAEHLINNPEIAANMTCHARTSSELRVTRINNNPSFSQKNFSALMFRRSMIDLIGPWDTVNRGADVEFRDRIILASGKPVEVLHRVPLSLTRTLATSLTGGEISRGYLDPARLLYQTVFMKAHAEVTDPAELKGIMSDSPKPLDMQPGNRGIDLGTFDVVFATDFRFPGGTSSLTLNEIEAASKEGLRVGILQLDSPLNSFTAPLSSRLLELVKLPNIEMLSLNDSAEVSFLFVRHPSVLQFVDNLTSRLKVGLVVVVINTPPILRGGQGVGFVIEDVINNVQHMFGVTPEIVPESGVTRKLAASVLRRGLMASYNWPGFIDVDRFAFLERKAGSHMPPVIGRHSRDSLQKWPSKRSEIAAVYYGAEDMRVRILGGASSLPKQVQKDLQKNSEVLSFGSISPEEFLQNLDFWVYFHSNEWTESFGMAVAEAMSTGLVVILPDYLQLTFGDGAVYADVLKARQKVAELWADPVAYQAHAKRAREYVEENFSLGAFKVRLKSAIERGYASLSGN